MVERIKPLEKFRFPNGNFFFSNGRVIDPKSREGKRIIAILETQKATRKANQIQRELFRRITTAKNSAEANRILLRENVAGKGASIARIQARKGIGHLGIRTKAMIKQEIFSLENKKDAFLTPRERLKKRKKLADLRSMLAALR